MVGDDQEGTAGRRPAAVPGTSQPHPLHPVLYLPEGGQLSGRQVRGLANKL